MDTAPAQSGHEKLAKLFKDGGNSNFTIGILMLIQTVLIPVLVSMTGNSLSMTNIVIMVLLVLFAAYFIYAGLKMKNDTFSNLAESSKNALILTWLSVVALLLFSSATIVFFLFYLFLVINNARAYSQANKMKKSHPAAA